MTTTDQRRVRVSAPPEGGRAAPPPRRPAQVVAPEADAPSSPVPVTTPGAPRRVVIPAPGTATADPPPARADGPPVRPASPSPVAADPVGWRRWIPSKRVVGAIAAVLVLLVAGTLMWGYRKFQSIERVDLSAVLASGDGTNYLIVGSDSRDGVDPERPQRRRHPGRRQRRRPRTIGHDPDPADRLARAPGPCLCPRDLFVTISETGQRSRINAAFNGGPARLIATLRDQLHLPIHHYLEVDFVSFASMVDALGWDHHRLPQPGVRHPLRAEHHRSRAPDS